MDGAWESVSCLLCGRDDPQLLLEGPDRLHNLPGRFRLVRCRRCGLIYQNPRLKPEALAHYYPNDYPPHRGEKLGLWARLDAKLAYGKRLRTVGPFVQTGRLLDIGCGSGGFLRAMAEAGWEVYGLEPSPKAAELARRFSGAQVIVARLEEADLPPEFFDVVTMWDVVEHLHEPLAGLKRAAAALKPGGRLVVSTPDFGSPDRRLFGKYWFGYDLPRHLYIFTRDTLTTLLSRAGFEVVAVGHFTAHYQVLAGSFRHFVAARWGEGAARLAYEIVYSLPARVLTLPLVRAAALFNIGPVMTVSARKARHA